MKRRLTLQEVDDIIYIHNFRYHLPESWKPYFDWYVWEVSHGTFKPIIPKMCVIHSPLYKMKSILTKTKRP